MSTDAAGREDADAPVSPRAHRPRSGLRKRSSVTKMLLPDDADTISPLILPNEKEFDAGFSLDATQSRRNFHGSLAGKRMSSRSSLKSVGSYDAFSSLRHASVADAGQQDAREILAKVTGWLNEEKSKRTSRQHSRSFSGSADNLALDKLEDILSKAMHLGSQDQLSSARSSRSIIHRSSYRKLRRQSTAYASDTDFGDAEFHVPECDATLDNSKTLAYSGGASTSQINLLDESLARTTTRDRDNNREAWQVFKFEILRLIHTLRLKRWRRLPMENSSTIEVKRLSGALTNAVYVVSPPQDTSLYKLSEGVDDSTTLANLPAKLLLRIYGPQVEHLINRQEELQILKRLARKKIGPRLLGTFNNGRFEEFFDAETLKPQDLRNPSTSKQIAMRMRELHEGIELLSEERHRGPFVWQNWNNWVDRAEGIVLWLDQQTNKSGGPNRKFACGTTWQVFRKTVESYRKWLEDHYGGADRIRDLLVFAHNDTQYGNILRLQPPGESPLLLPANKHRQLIVIDFEYANANPVSVELANHFTEWCYNYHDPDTSWMCNIQHYPTVEEQQRFARAYLAHRPHFATHGSSGGASSTLNSPVLRPTSSSFKQPDSLAAQFGSIPQNTNSTSGSETDAVEALLAETRLWRLVNSALWVTWGIVQARVPGMQPQTTAQTSITTPSKLTETPQSIKPGDTPVADPLAREGQLLADGKAVEDKGATEPQGNDGKKPAPENNAIVPEANQDDEEEFDYLSYARDRALFFWGDALQFGAVQKSELPPELLREIKVVPY